MENLSKIIESILFVSGKEVLIKDISEKLQVDEKDVLESIKELQKVYSNNSGIYLLIFNNKLQFASNPKYADFVSNVLNPIREKEFTKTILEVSSIIAYKQPITKTEIEFIRGTKSCDYAIQTLLNLNMIEPVGRKEAIGRPILYGTTDNFLKRFQLTSLKDLPQYEDLLNKIQLLHPDTENDDYLFKKDIYKEENDDEQLKEVAFTEDKINIKREENIKKEKETELNYKQTIDKKLENRTKKILESEEIPDFLKDEDVIVIE